MGYMLPLRFINVSTKPKVSICATRIVAMMSTDIYQARRTIHEEKKAGTLINACGINAAKTAIILDNGSVVSSPLSITVLMNAIEKSNIKQIQMNSSRLKVYDITDEIPDPRIDTYVNDVGSIDNTDEEDLEEDSDDESEEEINSVTDDENDDVDEEDDYIEDDGDDDSDEEDDE